MQRWTLGLLLLAVLCLATVPSQGASDTFQQGASGYSGCVDTMISKGGYTSYETTNYGSSADLVVESQRWAST